jgi:hypothetical protein
MGSEFVFNRSVSKGLINLLELTSCMKERLAMETGSVGNNQRGITITVYFSVLPLEENWIVQRLIGYLFVLKTRTIECYYCKICVFNGN